MQGGTKMEVLATKTAFNFEGQTKDTPKRGEERRTK